MAEGLDLGEIVRRTVQANARFYKGWVDLSLEYFRGIAEIFGGTEPAADTAAEPDAGAGALVLEGEAGAAARGAFLVTNDLGRTVSCELVASAFRDPAGSAVQTTTKFEPATIELAPGEQRVVHATIVIADQLSEGVGYSGEFAIRGMDGFAVPVVLRRLHPAARSPIDREAARAQAAAPRAAAKPAGRTKAAAEPAAGTPKKSRRKKSAARRRKAGPK